MPDAALAERRTDTALAERPTEMLALGSVFTENPYFPEAGPLGRMYGWLDPLNPAIAGPWGPAVAADAA